MRKGGKGKRLFEKVIINIFSFKTLSLPASNYVNYPVLLCELCSLET